jgi:hypothetical protein
MRLKTACAKLSLIAIAAFTLAACQPSTELGREVARPLPDGAQRRIVQIEYTNTPTRAEVTDKIVQAAETCWLGKNQAFANLTMERTAPEGDTHRVKFKDPKKADRYAEIVVFPATGSSGYIIMVLQKGTDIENAARDAATSIEHRLRLC